MNSSLHMVRSSELEMGFFLGHKAVHLDRPDLKLLGRRENRLLGMWWLHVGVRLPKPSVFPLLAMRRRHDGTQVAWKFLKPWKWPVVPFATGDSEFDALFEILVEEGPEGGEVLGGEARAQLMRLAHDPYFNNLLFLVSPHAYDYLTVVNPPLPSSRNPSVEVIESVACALCTRARP